MPSNRSKRAAKKLQELQESRTQANIPENTEENTNEINESEEQPEKSEPSESTSTRGFSLLATQEEEGEEEGDDQDASRAATKPKSKKKKKKSKTKKDESSSMTPSSQVVSSPQREESETKEEKLDEIDLAIRELSMKNKGLSFTGDGAPELSKSAELKELMSGLRNILSLDPKHLDAEYELKKLFGADVIRSTAAATTSSRSPRNSRLPIGKRGRTMLAQVQPNWPPIHLVKQGLNMEHAKAPDDFVIVEEKGTTSDTWFTFTHSRSYIETQHMFLEAVNSLNPNSLMAILRANPYHIDTVLQLSDMSVQQGDQGQAEVYVDCALHAYENAFSPQFQLAGGNARLLYSKVENRGLFRALERRVAFGVRQGTWRTALEFCKALFCLDPYTDPYGALFYLDFLALQSQQYSWYMCFLEIMLKLHTSIQVKHIYPEYFPGLLFSKALAKWNQEDENKEEHAESSKILQSAGLRFPMTLSLLLMQVGIDLPSPLVTCERAKICHGFSERKDFVLHLLSQIYVSRTESLWRRPEVLSWLKKVINDIVQLIQAKDNPDTHQSMLWERNGLFESNMVPQSILRHAYVSDIAAVKSMLPSSILRTAAESFTFDPLPPKNMEGYTAYDDAYFEPIMSRLQSQQRGQQDQMGNRIENNEGMLRRLAEMLRGMADDRLNLDPETQQALLEQLDELGELDEQHRMAGVALPDDMGEDEIDLDIDRDAHEEQRQDSTSEDATDSEQSRNDGNADTYDQRQEQQEENAGWGRWFGFWR